MSSGWTFSSPIQRVNGRIFFVGIKSKRLKIW